MIELTARGTADQRSAGLRLRVEAGSWTAAELKGLPGGGSLMIEARSDGPLRLALVLSAQRDALPDPETAIFSRRMQARLAVEAALPAAGDYLLLADNRGQDAPRDVELRLIANAVASQPQPRAAADLAGQLAELAVRLDRSFRMDGLIFAAEPLAPAGLIRRGNRIVLGGDCDRALVAALGDADLARDALLFALLHSVAQRWISADKVESMLPEHLAGALMILFNQLDAARRQADRLASGRPLDLSLPGLNRDAGDPLHPVSARSIARRLRNPQALLAQMQGPLLARMRPETLARLQSEAPAWADPDRIARALGLATGLATGQPGGPA